MLNSIFKNESTDSREVLNLGKIGVEKGVAGFVLKFRDELGYIDLIFRQSR